MPVRKRPCRVCRKWFQPHPRAGDRQRVCSSTACQRERHRRACHDWHQANPDYDRGERVRKRIRPEPAPPGASGDPLLRLDWDAVRDAVGLEVAVIIEESRIDLRDWVRDAVARQTAEIIGEFLRHGPDPPRDDIARTDGAG